MYSCLYLPEFFLSFTPSFIQVFPRILNSSTLVHFTIFFIAYFIIDNKLSHAKKYSLFFLVKIFYTRHTFILYKEGVPFTQSLPSPLSFQAPTLTHFFRLTYRYTSFRLIFRLQKSYKSSRPSVM